MSWLKKLFCFPHKYIWTGKYLHFLGEGTKTSYICSKCEKIKHTWLIRTRNK